MDWIKSFFTIKHLTEVPSGPIHYGLYFFIFLGFCIIGAIVLYFVASRKKIRFQKDFYKRMADAFLYMPIILVLYVFLRYLGVTMISQRILGLFLVLIWLIWLIFLVYYRLVDIPRLNREYNKKKLKERYLQNGKGTK